jgi:hypothetical protein
MIFPHRDYRTAGLRYLSAKLMPLRPPCTAFELKGLARLAAERLAAAPEPGLTLSAPQSTSQPNLAFVRHSTLEPSHLLLLSAFCCQLATHSKTFKSHHSD